MAPQPDQLQPEKRSVLDRLGQKTIAGTEDDVLGLRNLDISGFARGPQVLQEAIAAWLRVRIAQGTGGALVAKEIFLANHSWKQAASAALSDVFELWSSKHAALLWHWWMTEPVLVAPSQVMISKKIGDAEGDLVSTLPTVVVKELRDPVLALSKSRGWCLLHGAVLAAAPDLTTVEKLRSQIELEPDLGSVRGLELLVSRANVAEMFAAALELEDARLLHFAGRAAARSPELITNIDASTSAWRAIWLSYIQAGRELFDGIAQPAVAAHAVMDALLAGSLVPAQLLEHLASQVQSDLATYGRRRELWRTFPAAVTKQALQITAKTWLTRFLADPTFDPPALEAELQDAVIACWRSSPSLSTAVILPGLWDRFALLTEADFLAWFAAYGKPLTRFEACGIGRLVSQHEWGNAAAEVARGLRYGRNDLAAAVDECIRLLGFWDRFHVAVFTDRPVMTLDEWWSEWLELSSRLYPWGIDDNNIWTDADGDVSRVKRGTGREQWGHALDLLRKGGAGGTMTVEGLLHEMRKDFQANSDLKLLENIFLKHFRRT
jgi:hypothetical protein